ncbi:MAG TPA: gamma-glutamyl-gamma-aminobutyrate hydrolase family protein [Acidobacteriaceae bacterium]|jgi:putative glutamine amidotransferase|nr:gamma-glutamyl-gamma-aminobutyrate hydrolase family protein [Acidobacteriaceae bacterium]
MKAPRIAIPEPNFADREYSERSWPQYARAVQLAGGEPVKVQLQDSPAKVAQLVASCEGVLLPGSPADVNPQKYGEEADHDCAAADPAREAVDELLLQDASNLYKPLLGICYGFQSLNVWRGGTLLQHLKTAVDHTAGSAVAEAHAVEVDVRSRLRRILGLGSRSTQMVNSSHHQAVGVLGDGLVRAAWSVDDGVVEAAEVHGDHFLVGVQWHPERILDESKAAQCLFQSFVDAAAAWEPRMISESVVD